jgi:hypothetical protein
MSVLAPAMLASIPVGCCLSGYRPFQELGDLWLDLSS